ncbi:MAG: hypothetical protein PQJ60_08940 [Spirochaetales bacterium]|nr:hypothetical protein [Spirochaetales bacterium]
MISEKGKMKFIALGILGGVGALLFAALLALLFGWVLMLLWNWLMPDIFGLPAITYIQGWGLILISHLLFKGHGRGGHKSHPHPPRRGRHMYGPGEGPSREDMDFFKREFRSRMRKHWDDDRNYEDSCRDEDERDGTDRQS